jgi:hypothetical protein
VEELAQAKRLAVAAERLNDLEVITKAGRNKPPELLNASSRHRLLRYAKVNNASHSGRTLQMATNQGSEEHMRNGFARVGAARSEFCNLLFVKRYTEIEGKK